MSCWICPFLSNWRRKGKRRDVRSRTPSETPRLQRFRGTWKRKSEFRNSKSETNSNDQRLQCLKRGGSKSGFGFLKFGFICRLVCFGFRYSDFEFLFAGVSSRQ